MAICMNAILACQIASATASAAGRAAFNAVPAQMPFQSSLKLF